WARPRTRGRGCAPERGDPESARGGVANLFPVMEPLRGSRLRRLR
ncbi:MAG: hypothetical protein AVDCRST_MAG73-3064, partial [uncultured Thermomicrobiales bacterium]